VSRRRPADPRCVGARHSIPSLTQYSDDAVVSNEFWPDPPLAHCAITGTVALVPMPTADATLLPPAFLATGPAEERGSARRLDDVGVEAVLGAMIEQKRRASQPSFAAIDLPPADESQSEAPPSSEGEPRRTPSRSEVFLKAR
jgi:hypothetical protein